MKVAADLLEIDPPLVPKVPAWARPRGEVQRDVDAGYLAGAALNSLDNLVRGTPGWGVAAAPRTEICCGGDTPPMSDGRRIRAARRASIPRRRR